MNVWGVIHGIKAFVPAMLEHGDEGHVVNTSSGNGGVSPLPGTPIYATTKASVVTITECLYAQLQSIDAPHRRIGALSRARRCCAPDCSARGATAPTTCANPTPRKTPPTTIESFEKRMADAGVTVDYTPVEEVADRVVDAIVGQPVLDPPRERARRRADQRPGRHRCWPARTPTISATSPADPSRETDPP